MDFLFKINCSFSSYFTKDSKKNTYKKVTVFVFSIQNSLSLLHKYINQDGEITKHSSS